MLTAHFVTRSLSAEIRPVTMLQAEFGARMVEGGSYEDYAGEYIITPKVEPQTLETEKKTTRENIVVKAIPYYEVSNQTGETVIIGG